MKPKQFSIIIPTYNCGRKLAETIESVLSQRRDLYEICVVDGASTDETLSVIDEYSGALRFVSQADRSVYDGMNKGIDLTTGRYLLFLGAGDVLRDGVLERVAGMLPKENLSFVYGDTMLLRHGIQMCGRFSMREFMNRNICQQAIFYERSIFEVFGRFDVKYKVYADWAFNMKCFADKRVRKTYVDMVIADFEGWGISDTQKDPVFYRDLPGLIRKYVGLNEYMQRRIYRGRVAIYEFRHRLARFSRVAVTQAASMLRRQKS